MAKKITDNTPLQSFEEDWGGIYESGPNSGKEWGKKHSEVERVIKEKVAALVAANGTKAGSVLALSDESGLVTVRLFATKNDRDAWQDNPSGNENLVLDQFSIQGAGETAEYTMTARVVKPVDTVQVAGEENIFTFLYNSYWGSDPTDYDPQPGNATVTVNGVLRTALTLAAGGGNVSVNIGQYINQETNEISITVSNAHGKSRTWEYTVEAKSLSVQFTEGYLSQQHIAKQSGWLLPVLVNGVGGMVHVSIDDGVLEYERDVAGGTQASFAIDSNGTMERGTHTVDVWCEDTVFGLMSNHIHTSFIVASQSMGVAIGADATEEVTMYDAVQVPYYFYSPSDAEGTDVEVTVRLEDSNGVTLSESTQQVTVDENHSSGLQQAVVQVTDNSSIGHDVVLTISIGQGAGITSVSHTLRVNAAEVTLREASECKVHYSMAGKTNSDSDVVSNSMTSDWNGVQTSRLLLSNNFVLKQGTGFVAGGLYVSAQRRATLKDWMPFASDFGVNGSHEGRTIEMEFAIGTASDMDEPVISCMDSRCGFEIFPTRIEVKYASSESRIITYFPDGERIKFSLVINGTATNCVNDDGNGNVESRSRNLGFLYVNGVMVRIFDYAESSWQQQTVKEIVFGSMECGLTIYSIRGYEKALTMREILDNYSYDTPLLADKIAIAKRNDVLQSDGITIALNKIRAALPKTPIIKWWVERLPSNKKDPRECLQTDFENPEWDESQGKACAPFTAGPHEINGDGTSSNSYPLPYKNWAEKYKDYGGGSQGIITLHLEEGDETVKKYSITIGVSSGETKYVHKVNFASSEGIFNILAMNMYQLITVNSYRSINNLLSLQQQGQVDRGEDITFRKSLSGFPEIGFRTYTENGQVVTKFLSIYNFINNKKTGSMFGMVEDYKVNQLWEIDENVNFFNTPMTEHSVDGQGNLIESNGVREKSPFYYSRFPADSPVNDGCDLGLPENASQVEQANDEIRVLRMSHNWVVSINPNVAERYKARYGEYRPFTLAEDGFTSKTYAGTEYTRDTPAYRAQKFMAECDDWLWINDCIFYFLFCVYILGMDSMDKNMSLFFDLVSDFYSDDPAIRAAAKAKLRIMLRDTDTGELFNNSGVLSFKYWHEWNDTYNPLTGETGQITGETWDSETRTYHIETNVVGSSPIFNGRMSGLWDAISNFIPNQIRTVYQAMRQAGLNYNTFMTMYERFRNYWCEALYNVDGLGYANTGNFTMAYGDKLMVAKYFFKYRERYMDSKYGYALDSHQVTLRLSSVPNGIWMKHSTPIYASFSYGGSTPTTARSIVAGEPALLPCTANTFNDATCYINDADLVTEIGTYTVQSGGTVIYAGLEGMQRFHFTFNFGRLIRLRKFIWACTAERPNTEQTTENGEIDFSALTMLRELVMTYCTSWEGRPVIGSDIIERIDFRGTPIKGISIPSTETLTELRLPDTLDELRLSGLPNLATFSMAGYSHLDTVIVDDVPAINVFSLLGDIYNTGHVPTEVVLHGINETLDAENIGMLTWLAQIENADLTGVIHIDNSYSLSYTEKQVLIEAFGDIDDENNPLHITYAYNINNSLTVDIYCDGVADQIGEVGTYQMQAIPNVAGVYQPDVNYIRHINWSVSENDYVTINPTTGLLTVSQVGTSSSRPSITVYLEVMLINGTVLESQLVISLWPREAALGDYVYADGSYSASLISTKTVVGILHLDENGVREICSPENMTSDMWGLYSGNVSGVTVDGTTSAYNLPIPDISSNGASHARDTNTNYFDKTNDEFKVLSNGTAAGRFYYDASVDVDIDGLVDRVTLRAGRRYSIGYYETLMIIGWRNRILAYAGLGIPVDSAERTEKRHLQELISAIVSSNNNNYRQYYFPAASFCYAYEPSIKPYETLDDRFKLHKWFLPGPGSLARMIFYWLRNDATGTSRYDAFKMAKGAGRINFSNSWYWSSTECNASNAWFVYGGDGNVYNTNKNNSNVVRPVCAF